MTVDPRRTRHRLGPSALVVTAAAGEPVNRNTFNQTWRRALVKAGLTPGLRLHDLRHAYASALIAAGESVKVVQKRMGHSSAMITLDVYSHLWPDSDDRTRSAIEAFLAPADSVRTGGAFPQVSAPSTDFLK